MDLAKEIRMASRALARHGFVHAYGHCSARIDARRFLVSPPKPLGLILPEEACTEVALDEPLPKGVLGEVRVHREIYRRRPDVGAVIRAMPPNAMALSAMLRTPKPRHGFGAYFCPEPPLWSSPQLLRSDEQAADLAEQLAASPGIMMYGNGVVIAGQSLPQAATLTYFLEDMCRVELAALALSPDGPVISPADAAARATWSGGIAERMWAFLTAGDPEQ